MGVGSNSLGSPLVSVIVPTYNNAETLDSAIDSIANQTVQDIEIVVVDDASEDATPRIILEWEKKDPRVRSFRLPPNRSRYWGGVNVDAGYRARNTGLSAAAGDWITFQDGDDWSVRNRLEVQLQYARALASDMVTTAAFSPSTQYRPLFLDVEKYVRAASGLVLTLGPDEIREMCVRTSASLARRLPDGIYSLIPFRIKRSGAASGLFIRDWSSYPGAANSVFVKRERLGRVRFRPLNLRRWPSYKGRGADRDFCFQMALRARAPYFVDLPLYAWRTPSLGAADAEVQQFFSEKSEPETLKPFEAN